VHYPSPRIPLPFFVITFFSKSDTAGILLVKEKNRTQFGPLENASLCNWTENNSIIVTSSVADTKVPAVAHLYLYCPTPVDGKRSSFQNDSLKNSPGDDNVLASRLLTCCLLSMEVMNYFIYGFNVLDDDDDNDINNVIFMRSKSIFRNASTIPVEF